MWCPATPVTSSWHAGRSVMLRWPQRASLRDPSALCSNGASNNHSGVRQTGSDGIKGSPSPSPRFPLNVYWVRRVDCQMTCVLRNQTTRARCDVVAWLWNLGLKWDASVDAFEVWREAREEIPWSVVWIVKNIWGSLFREITLARFWIQK